MSDLDGLFTSLVAELHEGGFALALDNDPTSGPFVTVLDRPERKSQVTGLTPFTQTTIRLRPYALYLQQLDHAFPRLFDRIAAACYPQRPFLVIEGWVRYVELGERLLGFARRHGLNLRCVEQGGRESRLNDLCIRFYQASHQWQAADAPVDDMLRDPRRQARSGLAAWNPRWWLRRAGQRLSACLRRAASLMMP